MPRLRSILVVTVLAATAGGGAYWALHPGGWGDGWKEAKGARGGASDALLAANKLVEAGKPVEAQRLLEASLKTYPTDAATNEALADMVLESLGETAYSTVKPLYETALKREPGRASAALHLSKIYLAENRPAAALPVLAAAVQANARDVALRLEFANLLMLLHKYEEAGPQFDVATALKPGEAEAWCTWGLMLVDAGEGRLAEEKFRKAVDLDKTNPKYRMHLGRALRSTHHYSEALNAFETATDLDEKYAPAYYEAGLTLVEMREQERGESFLRRAIEMDPAYTEAKVKLAQLLASNAESVRHDPIEVMDLLRQAVAETHEQDLSLLAAYADAIANVAVKAEPDARESFYDQAIAQMDKAIALGEKKGITAGQSEFLIQLRQSYAIALLPPVEGNATLLSVDGFKVHAAVDDPWPLPPQPKLESLVEHRLDYSVPPKAGDALDPELYIRDLFELPQAGFR